MFCNYILFGLSLIDAKSLVKEDSRIPKGIKVVPEKYSKVCSIIEDVIGEELIELLGKFVSEIFGSDHDDFNLKDVKSMLKKRMDRFMILDI